MDLKLYFDGTNDTWNTDPINTYSYEEMNFRLQVQNTLVGMTGEYNEFCALMREYEDSDNLEEIVNKFVDEIGDINYYIARNFALLFKYETYENLVNIYQQLYSTFDHDGVLFELNTLATRINDFVFIDNIFFDQIKKPIFRKNKEFNLEKIYTYTSTLLRYILVYSEVLYRTADVSFNDIIQYNYDKLHNTDNLNKRGLELSTS